jgi:hypothetical protein
LLSAAAIAGAATLAVVRVPANLVEYYFADWLYPAVQTRLTAWSNAAAFALFDLLIGFAATLAIVLWGRWIAQAVSGRRLGPLIRGAFVTVALASAGYLWFLGAWGLNYARPPLESAIAFDSARVTAAAVADLAERTLLAVNRTHAAGHAAGFPGPQDRPPALVRALHDVERQLGRPAPTLPSVPKRTLLAPFFRRAGVDGMHAPFLLETLLNPDLTPVERPAILAHEWAHLAGYAPEDEASFVGIVTALAADPGSQYSGWLTLFHEALGQVPEDDQRRLVARLEPGPRADRQAIAERLRARNERVARASWDTYDRYLKTQGVSEGVASYSRVVQLIVGSQALDRPAWRQP